MQHHRHPSVACRPGVHATETHPDALRDDAQLVWFPVAATPDIEPTALEGLACVPTRDGAVRVAAVPHLAHDVALGDEVAVGAWEGGLIARGPLASALVDTLRVTIPPAGGAQATASSDDRGDELAAASCGSGDPQLLVELAAPLGALARWVGEHGGWIDVLSPRVAALAVPRHVLIPLVSELEERGRVGELRYEYATPGRAPRIAELAASPA